jgi:tripartite-type tricarboxylate transporter receptor subunit TctC
MTLSRRDALSTIIGAASATALATSPSSANAWPVPQILITVPFPAGGTVDQLARLVQPGLQQRLGATVVIENRPGAQGSLGASQVVKSASDGANWLFVFDTHAVNPTLQKLPFDTKTDLDPVLLIGTSPHVLITHPDRPWRTFQDVITAAKKDPGKLTYGSIGTGSLGHLTMVLLTKRAGIELTHVPYRGGGPLLNDSLGGHVDFSIASSALFNTQIASNTLVPILQTGADRAGSAQKTPTAIEAGYTGFESYAWWGVFAPKGTPEALSKRMHDAIIESLKEPVANKQITQNMQITPKFGGPDVLRTWLNAQMALWGAVVADNNIKAGQ